MMLILADSANGLLDYINKGGVVAVFIIVFWAILTRRIVPGWVYEEALKREQKWEALAMTGVSTTREAVGTLRDVVPTEGEAHASTPR